jgi:hypothetical protein
MRQFVLILRHPFAMRLFPLVFFLCLFFQAFSQSRFNAGIFGGIAATQVSGDNYGGFDKAGIIAGGLVNRKFSPKFSIQLELMYIQKGSRHIDSLSFYQMKLSYAEIPLMFRYHQSDRLIAEAGISYGRLLAFMEEDATAALTDRIPFYPYEVSIMGGFNFALYKKLWMDWRFSTSILPIRPHPGGATYYLNRGQYNTVLQFAFHYYLTDFK